MSTQIVDLDALLGDDKRVKLGGKTYTLPADLPVELYLKINRAAKEGMDDALMVETLYDEVLDLFRYKAPDLDALPLSMNQLVGAIGAIYGDKPDDESEEDPTTPKTRGASSGKSRNRRSAS